MIINSDSRRKPDWLKIKLPKGEKFNYVSKTINQHHLNTICLSGKCPNIAECWASGTATFMILGNICTRNCRFCAVESGKPFPPDVNEPENIAHSVRNMKLKHCVVTSVDRDDLADYGANHWNKTIKTIKEVNPDTTIEVLIPDFGGKYEFINIVTAANPEIISHNLETVERLTPKIRSVASYKRSLDLIRYISSQNITSKSGIMLGLGETKQEILQTMDDLLKVGCQIFTLGQYLQPTKDNIEVAEYIHPDTFLEYKNIGLQKGFRFVESNPLVRSSYHAEKHIESE